MICTQRSRFERYLVEVKMQVVFDEITVVNQFFAKVFQASIIAVWVGLHAQKRASKKTQEEASFCSNTL